jgi:hypothetical protein
MSSPVGGVPPDMRLTDVADLLVTRAMSAVPVVADGELVDLISGPTRSPGAAPRPHRIPPIDATVRRPEVATEAMT